MATEITLTRKASAKKLDRLLADDGLWKVLKELEVYLQAQDIRRLTADDVLTFLKPRYGDATLVSAETFYVPYWDVLHNCWRYACVADGKIEIPDGPIEDTIVVGFKVSASYA
jgi:hypothetical protein